jgi:hypothetical protein
LIRLLASRIQLAACIGFAWRFVCCIILSAR